ncbi:hypothetical protein [Microbacterium lacticum]
MRTVDLTARVDPGDFLGGLGADVLRLGRISCEVAESAEPFQRGVCRTAGHQSCGLCAGVTGAVW